MGQRFLRLLQDLVLPGEQLQAEILPLALVHERLFVRRSVGLVLVDYSDAILLRGHCYPMPKTKRTPCSRGELISSRAMADNNRFAAARVFGALQKKGAGAPAPPARTAPVRSRGSRAGGGGIRLMYLPHGGRRHYCGCSTALIDSALALDAGACTGKRMRRSEISCIRASPVPVARESTCPPRVLSALRKWKC